MKQRETPDPNPPPAAEHDPRDRPEEELSRDVNDDDAVDDFFAELRLGQEGVTEGVITFW